MPTKPNGEKVMTLHLHGKRLTPRLVRVLGSLAEELDNPELRQTQAGTVVYASHSARAPYVDHRGVQTYRWEPIL